MSVVTGNKVVPKLRFREFEENYNSTKVDEIAEINPKNNNLPVNFVYIDLESVKKGVLLKENIISRNSAPSRAQRVLKKGDILYQSVRPYQKNNYLFKSKGDYVASTGYFQIKAKINNNYLYQYFHNNNFVNKVLKLCTGSNYPTIGFVDFGKISIKVPSLNEQKKIASFLSAVDEKIQQLTKKKELLEDYKKGIMQKIFSQEIRFKDDNDNEYPNWDNKKLGDLCDIKTGKLDANAADENGKYRFYTCAKNYFQIDKYEFDTDALIISGNGANVGYIHHFNGKFNAYQRTYVLDKFKLNIYYLKYFLNKNLYRRIYREKKDGATPYIVMATLFEMKILIPEANEQKKIATFLSSVDKKIESVNHQLEKTKEFKKGLLQQMFV